MALPRQTPDAELANLTHYAHGDTRQRGSALLRLKHTFADAGWALTVDELPDHLAVALGNVVLTPHTQRCCSSPPGLSLDSSTGIASAKTVSA